MHIFLWWDLTWPNEKDIHFKLWKEVLIIIFALILNIKLPLPRGEKNYSIKFRYVCLKCDMDVKDQRNDPPSDPYMPTT
jgi:hypothetical protein